MSNKDLDDFFNETFEKRPPAAKWGKIREGDRCVPNSWEGGEILSIKKEQKMKWEGGKPVEKMFWDDGTERWQGVVTIQTTQVGVIDADDNGQRTLYIEGAMKKAVSEALKEAGAPGLRVGGKLAIQNTGMAKNAAGYLAYTWFAKYIAPVVQADDFFNEETSVNHQGNPQPTAPPDWATEEPARKPSTLDQIRAATPAHQAQLKPDYDDSEPPF